MNRDQAHQLHDEFCTPTHVRAHCLQVARISELLAQKLMQNGEKVDPELAWIGGMIHDFVRVVDFDPFDPTMGTPEDQVVWQALRQKYKGKHHGDAGGEILKERGEELLAKILERHKFRVIGTPEGPQTWEEKLVYYADKRVAHDQIVSFEERFTEASKRHKRPPNPRKITNVKALEKEIFSKIDITPDQVKEILEKTI